MPRLALICLVAAAACDGIVSDVEVPLGSAGSGQAGGGSGTGGGSAGSGGGTGGAADPRGLPCAISAMLDSSCDSCHGTPLAQNAPVRLWSRADLIAPSAVDPNMTYAERAVTRMRASVAAMPPAGAPAVSFNDINKFEAWVTSGTPMGSCLSGTGGGSGAGGSSGGGAGGPSGGGAGGSAGSGGAGGGLAPTTCASNSYWSSGNTGSLNMNPGLACRACHLMLKPSRAYFFIGTVFPALHEKNLCYSQPPASTTIDIIDANGQVAMTLTPSTTSGNFHSPATTAGITLPYRARITSNGRTAMMTTPQTSGDCNSCHTEQGTNNAPGRITLP